MVNAPRRIMHGWKADSKTFASKLIAGPLRKYVSWHLFNCASVGFFLCSDQTTQANHRLLLLICGCQSVQWTNVYKKAFECPITKEAGQCSRNLLNLFGIMWWFLVARCCQRCFFFSNEIISPPLCNHQFNSTKYFCRSIAIFLANCFKESRAKR